MIGLKTYRQLLTALVLLLPFSSAWAEWELDSTRSSINFVSVKNDSVGEVHSFSSLLGFIGGTGNVQLTINLDSVDTLIAVRDERMRELLFETVKFPAANISANVDPAVLAVVAEGGVVSLELPVKLALHGHEKTLNLSVVVVGEGDGRIRVFSARPVLVNAADFGLEAGVAALQKIAGLQAISNAVPVTLQLLFLPAG